MRVTLINIENYLRYFIVKLKDGYFETGQINNLLDLLTKKFCLAKHISSSLSKRIWTNLLQLIITKYMDLYFVRESLDIKTVDLASKLTSIEANSNSFREFFEDVADTQVLNEAIYNVTYLIKFAKASTPKDVLDCIKIMISKDVVNSDNNLSNILEMKSRHIQEKQKLFNQLKIINDLRIKEISQHYPEVIMKISNKLFMQYIYLYAWVYKKADFKNRIFQKKKNSEFQGYKKYWATMNMGKIDFYTDIDKKDLEDSYSTMLMVNPESYENTEISYVRIIS